MPLTSLFAVDNGGQDACHRVHGAARHIGDLKVIEAGTAVFSSGGGGDTRTGEIVDVVAGPQGEGTALAVTGDGAVNEPGIDGPELFVSNAQLGHHTWAELFHHDVILHHQLFDNLNGGRLFQVEKDGLFVSPEPSLCPGHLRTGQDWWPVHHQVVLVPAADLQHLGTHIRQGHGSVGTGEQRAEIQYLVAVQCAHAHTPRFHENNCPGDGACNGHAPGTV